MVADLHGPGGLSNIPPGDYTFRVLARNASGVWTEHPEASPSPLLPPFGRTWFRIGGGTALLLGFLAPYGCEHATCVRIANGWKAW
ncbi:MAG: hypothetical protein IPH60_04735 [Flavobacteriales bacterium]|nr:hypothetical protein [Flavobacteriales bacterium]